MDITWRVRGTVSILTLTGRFVVSPGESEILPLRLAIRELVAEGRLLVGLNLAGVASIDARGLGELVLALTTIRQHGGDLVLVSPSAKVRKLLAVTRLDRVFPVCDGEAEMVGKFERATPFVQNGVHADRFARTDDSSAIWAL
jgi:anti-anti-sigma factor